MVSYSHYARGAKWLTWDVELAPGLEESWIMDKSSWDKINDYLGGKYLANLIPLRNTIPFSALTVWYIPGLDHEAHIKGISEYKNYFQQKTDYYINDTLNKLKLLDEFDNKIFITVADHGHTAMPWGGKIPVTDEETGQVKQVEPETSCKLNLEKFSKFASKGPEIANNNIHIYELAKLFSLFPVTIPEPATGAKVQQKLLVPKEIEELKDFKDAVTNKINEASIIAALNGPMAHIYIKGDTWQTAPNELVQATIISLLKSVFMDGVVPSSEDEVDLSIEFPRLLGSIDKILVRINGVYVAVTAIDDDLQLQTTPLVDQPDSYVDIVNRIDNLNSFARSGDIILLMKDRTYISDPNVRFTTGVACKSWHASLNQSDSFVPLILSYPGGNIIELQKTTNDVCTGDRCKGNWSLPDLVKHIINRQF